MESSNPGKNKHLISCRHSIVIISIDENRLKMKKPVAQLHVCKINRLGTPLSWIRV